MEYKLDKPYKLKNKWIFENSISDDFAGLTCRDTDDGVCYYNQSLDKCVERIKKGGMYFKIGNDSICMPVDIKNLSINPIQSFRKSSIFKQLDDVKTYSILDESYEFPPNISNAVFYNDIMTLKNTQTGWTIGKVEYPVEDHSPVRFDNDIDINIILISKFVDYLHTNEVPLLYGQNFAISSNGTSLTLNIGTNNYLTWHHITGYEKADFCFKILPIDKSKKIGDVVTYTDKFNLFCNDIPVYIDKKSGVLEFKVDTEVDYLGSFSFLPKIYGYYCDGNKSKKVLIKKIETDGVKGFYKGNPVYRNKECFGICDNNYGNPLKYNILGIDVNKNNILYIVIPISILVLIILIFLLIKCIKEKTP